MTPDPLTGDRGPDAGKPSTKTHSVHIRGVPEQVWRRARTNALLSGLPFKEYVTLLLAHCDPIPVATILLPSPEDGAHSTAVSNLETKPSSSREAALPAVTDPDQ
jgi:hypothetical protein